MPDKRTPWLFRKMMPALIGKMDDWEDGVVSTPGVHLSVEDSPVRFEIMKEGIKDGRRSLGRNVAPLMQPTLLGMRRSMTSLAVSFGSPVSCSRNSLPQKSPGCNLSSPSRPSCSRSRLS